MPTPPIPAKYKGDQEFTCFPLQPGDGREGVSLLGSHNFEVTPDGATPAFDHGAISGGGDKLHYWGSPVETKAPNGNPRQYAFVNDEVWRFEDGALTQDNDFGGGSSGVVQGLVLTDDAQTPPNERLIAFFGDSTAYDAAGGHYWRDLSTDTTPWTEHAGALALTAFGGMVVGADTFLTTGSAGQGRTVIGEHKVSKIPAGSFSGLAASAGPAEPVGNSDWPIIGQASYRGSPAWGKGDGVYYRNSVDKRYDPVRQLSKRLPHGLNSKVMVESENGIIYADNAGRLFEYNGYSEREITPLKDSRKPKDTQRGRIAWAADRGDVLAVGYAAYQGFIKGPVASVLGVRVFRRTAGTWTEITTDITDGSMVTPAAANMNAWGGTATDRLLVISPFPLAGIIPRVTRNPNAAVNSFITPRGSGGGAETAGALTVNLGSVRDATVLSVATSSLRLTGFPPGASEPVLSWTSISAFADVLSTVITVTGIGAVTGFGYEWSPTNTTAMTVTTTIDEMDFIPARPGLGLRDPSGPFTAANDFSSLWASGVLEEVYFGRRVGTGEYEWSNPYVINTGGGTLVASWTTAATGALTNGGQGLILYGRHAQYLIAEGVTRDPRRQRYPRLCQWTTTEPGPRLTVNNMAFRHSDGSLADDSIPKRIMGVEIEGRDIPIEDFIQVWFDGLDGRPAWNFRTWKGTAPGAIRGRAGQMRRATMHMLYQDTNQTDEFAPLIESVRIRWQYVGVEMQDNPHVASGSKPLS